MRPSPAAAHPAIHALVAENDGPFKHHLDRFRYAVRFPGTDPLRHRAEALAILRRWSSRLAAAPSAPGEPVGWLLGEAPCLADWALLPFVRQFRLADPQGFDAEPGLEPLRRWLRRFLEGAELARVMGEDWAPRSPWRSPRWLYHLALAAEWRQAAAAGPAGEYRRSTRGRSLEDVGYVHACGAGQVEATFRRYYADAGEVLLLTIDPTRLGAPVRLEASPARGELFPHIHGPLPVAAVLAVEPYRPPGGGEADPAAAPPEPPAPC